MTVQIRVFAHLKTVLGAETLSADLSEGASVAELLGYLQEVYPELRRWRSSVRVAVNWEYVPADTALQEGDELALIPPVSGG